jgi:hypothetical protein
MQLHQVELWARGQLLSSLSVPCVDAGGAATACSHGVSMTVPLHGESSFRLVVRRKDPVLLGLPLCLSLGPLLVYGASVRTLQPDAFVVLPSTVAADNTVVPLAGEAGVTGCVWGASGWRVFMCVCMLPACALHAHCTL